MTSIQTALTNLVGIKTPIVSAAMAGGAGGALAATVSQAGGLGFIGGYGTPEILQREVSIARDILKINEDAPLPIGVGLIGWSLEKDYSSGEKMLLSALDSKPKAIWFSFGRDLGHWIRFARENDPNAGTPDAVKIFLQTSTLDDALAAVNVWKVDVIIVQGYEAGGHGYSQSLPILSSFPILAGAIVQAAAAANQAPPVILASGGIVQGAQMAALLTLGAAGVVVGTRFLLSPESLYSDVKRQALLKANSNQSIRSMAFDHVNGTVGLWPDGVDGRGLRNDTVNEYERGVELASIKAKFKESGSQDPNRDIIWAGSSIGLVNEIVPASEILNELHVECLESLKKCASLVHN